MFIIVFLSGLLLCFFNSGVLTARGGQTNWPLTPDQFPLSAEVSLGEDLFL